jgi:hypothetical protein
MSRTDGFGACEGCGTTFPYHLIHNGFNESAYAYCSDCGQTALLDGWRMPDAVAIEVRGPVPSGKESLLQPCSCGGRFRGSASPRCPSCRHELSAVHAGEWIERNAPGTKGGWRWQRSWQGLYAIVISDRVVNDNWQLPKSAI